MAKFVILVAVLACVGWANAVTHAEAVKRFNAVGITITSSGGCSDRNKKTCTSFDSARENTVAGLVNLKKTASKCVINVTGGTETGHAGGVYSHWTGYKADISLNPCINDHVTKNFTYIGIRRDGAPMYESVAGDVYAKEGNHWDILYK